MIVTLLVIFITASALAIINSNRAKTPSWKLKPILIEISIYELDLASESLFTNVTIYIAQNLSDPIFVQVGWSERTEIAVNNSVHYMIEDQNGDYWKGSASVRIGVLGYSDWYPFDQYVTFLSFEDVPKYDTRLHVFTRANYFWDVHHDVSYEYTNIPVHITLKRNVWWSSVVLLPILAIYSMLGASLWVDASKKIGVRLTLFLAVFAAAFTHLFAISSDLPFRYFLSLPELLLFSIIICSSIFTVLSIVQTKKSFNGEILDLWALSLSLSIISICFSLMYIFAGFASSPARDYLPVFLVSLFLILLWNWHSKPIRVFQALSISICCTNIGNSFFLVTEYPKSSLAIVSIVIKFLVIGILVPSFAATYGIQASMEIQKEEKVTKSHAFVNMVFRIFPLILLLVGYLPLLSILDLFSF